MLKECNSTRAGENMPNELAALVSPHYAGDNAINATVCNGAFYSKNTYYWFSRTTAQGFACGCAKAGTWVAPSARCPSGQTKWHPYCRAISRNPPVVSAQTWIVHFPLLPHAYVYVILPRLVLQPNASKCCWCYCCPAVLLTALACQQIRRLLQSGCTLRSAACFCKLKML